MIAHPHALLLHAFQSDRATGLRAPKRGSGGRRAGYACNIGYTATSGVTLSVTVLVELGEVSRAVRAVRESLGAALWCAARGGLSVQPTRPPVCSDILCEGAIECVGGSGPVSPSGEAGLGLRTSDPNANILSLSYSSVR